MEAKYNDDELSDIMKAIEELETESSDVEKQSDLSAFQSEKDSLANEQSESSLVKVNLESDDSSQDDLSCEDDELEAELKKTLEEVEQMSQSIEREVSESTPEGPFLAQVKPPHKESVTPSSYQIKENNSLSEKKRFNRVDFKIQENSTLELNLEICGEVFKFMASAEGVEVFCNDGLQFNIASHLKKSSKVA